MTLVGRPVAVDGERVAFVEPALVATDGTPCRQDAAGPVPGLWYLGLRWLIRRRSSIPGSWSRPRFRSHHSAPVTVAFSVPALAARR